MGTATADIQLKDKSDKRFRSLLCVIDIYSKFAWIFILKEKKGINLVVNQTKYGYIKVVSFMIDKKNHCSIIMILKFI